MLALEMLEVSVLHCELLRWTCVTLFITATSLLSLQWSVANVPPSDFLSLCPTFSNMDIAQHPPPPAFLHLLMSFPVSVAITVFTVLTRKPNKLTLHCSASNIIAGNISAAIVSWNPTLISKGQWSYVCVRVLFELVLVWMRSGKGLAAQSFLPSLASLVCG